MSLTLFEASILGMTRALSNLAGIPAKTRASGYYFTGRKTCAFFTEPDGATPPCGKKKTRIS